MEKSAETEKLSSVAEIKNLTLRIDQVCSDNVAFQKLLQNQSQDQPVKSDSTNYGYFENVVTLDTGSDVTKPKIMNVVSQSRNPNFNRPLREYIQTRAKRVLDFKLMSNGYASTEEDISSWSEIHYINQIEKLFQNIHLETNTLMRFSKFKMGGLFISGEINQQLLNSLLEAIDQMTSEEVEDVHLQKSLINRAFSLLSHLEPAKIQMTSKVATCKTFDEFLMMWTRYRIQKQSDSDDLSAAGFVVLQKNISFGG